MDKVSQSGDPQGKPPGWIQWSSEKVGQWVQWGHKVTRSLTSPQSRERAGRVAQIAQSTFNALMPEEPPWANEPLERKYPETDETGWLTWARQKLSGAAYTFAVKLSNDFYKWVSSEKVHEGLAENILRWAYKWYSGGESLKKAPSEASLDHEVREKIGPEALTSCLLMARSGLRDFDQKAYEYAQKNKEEKCLVFDMGRSKEIEVKTKADSLVFSKEIKEILEDLNPQTSSSQWVWIPMMNKKNEVVRVGGKSIWIRRERGKMENEMRHTSKIMLKNVYEGISFIYDHEGEGLSEESTALLTDLFKTVTQHIKGQGPTAKEPNEQRAQEMGKKMKKWLFPEGMSSYPLAAPYRLILEQTLPQVFAKEIANNIKSMTDEASIRKNLLITLNQVPSAKELSVPPPDRVIPKMDAMLQQSAGEMVYTFLNMSSSRFKDLIENFKTFVAVSGIPIDVEELAKNEIGESIIYQIMEQGKDTKSLMNLALHNANEFLLASELSSEVSETPLNEKEEKEKVKEELGRVLADFIPYLAKGILAGIERRSHQVLKKHKKIARLAVPLPRRLYTVGESVHGRLFRLFEFEQLWKQTELKKAKKDAETALNDLEKLNHQEMAYRAMEIFFEHLDKKETP